jgi:hypothetical protein
MTYRISMSLVSCAIAVAIGSGSALAAAPTPAEKAAVKQAISSCKSEAKGKKVPWLQRRKYVKNCVIEALKDKPNIDVTTLLKNHPDMNKDLPAESADAM